MSDLFCDTETWCPTPIKDGSYRYAEDAEVMLFTWAIDDGPVQCWDVTTDQYPPKALIDAAADNNTLVWFQNGDHFDWPVLAQAMPDFAELVPVSRRRDTMVQAYSHSLPGSLDMLGRALGLDEEDQKLKSGRRLMHLFCKPQNDAFLKKYGTRRATRHTHPQEWEDFKIYAGRDITAMRGCQRRMPSWNYRGKQLDLWALDQKINARGIFIDLELAQAAVRASDIAKRKLAGRTQELTDGDVQAATQRDKMLRHILEIHGVDLPDMQADTIERRIKDESLSEELRELLRVRLASTTSSVAKFSTLIRGVNSDGRIRGTMQFRGAQRTGRCGHRLLQPGNMPRPDMKTAEIAFAIEMLKLDCAHLVFGNVMRVCSNAIRGLIAAPKGRKLVVADLANIEGRFAAWLAGEDWKLQAFRDYDTIIGHDAEGKPLRAGPDLYCLAYAKSFNVDPSEAAEDSKKRQIGKVEELMFQYGGGVGAWITGAATYGIDLAAMTESVYPTLPDWAIEEARGFLQWMYQGPQGVLDKKLAECRALALGPPTGDQGLMQWADEIEQRMQAARDLFEARCLKLRHGLTEKKFIACDSLKRLWRAAHPAISSYWKELEETIRACINDKGVQRQCRKLKIRCDGAWLRIGLPSGRVLCYPSPGIDVEVKLASGKTKTFHGISYMGISQYTKQWERIGTYGGKVFENCIAEGTPVLTRGGWVPIQDVPLNSQVWDGVRWVSHGGCVYRGKQFTMPTFNVDMTPDHRVLTTKGWRSASSCEGHHRAACRLPHGFEIPRQQRAPVSVGCSVPVRQNDRHGGGGTTETKRTGDSVFVRVYASSINRSEKHQTRDVVSPRLCGVAFDAGAVSEPESRSLQKIRRAGYQGLQAVARFVRSILVGHGPDLRERADVGAQEKQSGLFTEELHLGDPCAASTEYAGQQVSGNPFRSDDGLPGRGSLRGEADHVGVSTGPRLAGAESHRHVFDIMNCGPRQRFVVQGSDGLPLIVHNCVQAASADQLFECQPMIEEAGYPIVLHIHDENLTEPPDDPRFTSEELGRLMCSRLHWNEGLPLAAAGFEDYRYRKG